MRTPHRRDISARQDLLGRELRQLFDDYTQEDMPDELQRLAEQLQAAFEERPEGGPPQVQGAGARPAPTVPLRNGRVADDEETR
ncbi:hypothetical protein ACI7BZ_04100 [Xanthobacter sp. AM11]|uniref:hypothetical protein n=1 Tax=Xanthobacter sp. AM11 TaxID=3380643 RepID=UPI0039BEEE7F